MNNITLYVAAVLIWGSTFYAIEHQLGSVAPEVSIVYRCAIATLMLFGWCKWRHLNIKFRAEDHGWFALLGLLLFCLNYLLAYRAQVHITSALNAIAYSMVVWMNILNARIFFGIKTGLRVLFGSILGISGLVTLFAPRVSEPTLSDTTFYGLLFAVCGALAASLGSITSQSAQKRRLPVIQSNAWGMFYGTLLTGLLAVATRKSFSIDWSVGYLASLAYLALFGSVFAFGAYLSLVGRIGAHRAGYVVIMYPVVSLIMSSLFEGLVIDRTVIFGTALVLAGNMFVLGRAGSGEHHGGELIVAGQNKQAAQNALQIFPRATRLAKKGSCSRNRVNCRP